MKVTKRELPDTIGGRIQKLRVEANLTQGELAKEMGVKRETVNQWESETRDLKTTYTIKLADYFNVTCDEILRGVKSENIEVHKATGLSNDAIEVLINFNKTLENEELSEIVVLSRLLESEKFFGILNGIMWLSITAIHKLIYENEKKEKRMEQPLGKTLGKPIYELLEEDNNIGGLNRLMGGPVILNPGETYSFHLNELEKEFGKIVETLIGEMHNGKSLTDLEKEIDELTDGFHKGYYKGY